MKKPIIKKKAEPKVKETKAKTTKVSKKKDIQVSEKVLEVPQVKEENLLEGSNFINVNSDLVVSFVQPLHMKFVPQENITAYELAMCMQYFYRQVMPYEVDKTLPYFRHFNIVDPNTQA